MIYSVSSTGVTVSVDFGNIWSVTLEQLNIARALIKEIDAELEHKQVEWTASRQ